LHESLAQAPIPKRCTAKLLLRPAIALQALGQPQGTRNDRFHTAQALSEIRLQRIHIDGFDALGMAVLPVLATASLGLADLDPVGRLIAGARKPVGLHETLDEPGTIPVLRFEIQINTPQHHPQHAGGQIMTAHRGADQKAAHAYDTVQLLAPCLGIPADPVVPIGQLNRCRAEPQSAQPAVLGANQIAHLRADQRPGSLRVLAQHELVPDSHLLQRVDLDQTQIAYFTGMPGTSCGSGTGTPRRRALRAPLAPLGLAAGNTTCPERSNSRSALMQPLRWARPRAS